MAHLTTWNGSAHCTAFGQRSATISAIQSAWSADTCVIAAHAVGAEQLEEASAAWPGPGRARPTPAGRVSWSTTTVR